VLHIGFSVEFVCASGRVNRSLEQRKERTELIEEQLRGKKTENAVKLVRGDMVKEEKSVFFFPISIGFGLPV